MNINEPSAFHKLNISRSGLSAQRRRMDAISENLANLHTTRGAHGGPFQPRVVTLQEGSEQTTGTRVEDGPARLWSTHPEHLHSQGPAEEEGDGLSGVQSRRLVQNRRPRMEYDPEHPDADENGYVAYPDINVVEEMTQLIAASRAYEANLTALNAAKDMDGKALEI